MSANCSLFRFFLCITAIRWSLQADISVGHMACQSIHLNNCLVFGCIFDKWNRRILLELQSCSYIPSLSCLFLCLCLADESVLCIFFASSVGSPFRCHLILSIFQGKMKLKMTVPLWQSLFSFGNVNNSQNHCQFNIRLKTPRLKHSDYCNIGVCSSATHINPSLDNVWCAIDFCTLE